jgi:hypothetical protein
MAISATIYEKAKKAKVGAAKVEPKVEPKVEVHTYDCGAKIEPETKEQKIRSLEAIGKALTEKASAEAGWGDQVQAVAVAGVVAPWHAATATGRVVMGIIEVFKNEAVNFAHDVRGSYRASLLRGSKVSKEVGEVLLSLTEEERAEVFTLCPRQYKAQLASAWAEANKKASAK